MIVVAGEALIDLILHPDGHLTAIPGGGPFNTARTVGRLGVDVAFLGRLSTDRFGGMLATALTDDGVDLRWVASTDVPTTLAVAELDADGAASYRFHLAETSAPTLGLDDVLAALRNTPRVVHVGTLGLVVEPIASALAAGIAQAGPETLVMVDPNCRPRVIRDRAAYLRRLRSVFARADIVKVSADDLAYLAPDVGPTDASRTLLSDGCAIVLLTDGGSAVSVFAPEFEFELPVPKVTVVDTVGAGDAFGGGFLARWVDRGFGRPELADQAAVRDAVSLAIDVAVRTCLRPGADPPHRSEVAWTTP
ncbi:MAG: fructokinase [Chloroflexota bacterium]|nr:fructokinase [Chloroflexota bacterium]